MSNSTRRNIRKGAWKTACAEARQYAKGELEIDPSETCNPDVFWMAWSWMHQ